MSPISAYLRAWRQLALVFSLLISSHWLKKMVASIGDHQLFSFVSVITWCVSNCCAALVYYTACNEIRRRVHLLERVFTSTTTVSGGKKEGKHNKSVTRKENAKIKFSHFSRHSRLDGYFRNMLSLPLCRCCFFSLKLLKVLIFKTCRNSCSV